MAMFAKVDGYEMRNSPELRWFEHHPHLFCLGCKRSLFFYSWIEGGIGCNVSDIIENPFSNLSGGASIFTVQVRLLPVVSA